MFNRNTPAPSLIITRHVGLCCISRTLMCPTSSVCLLLLLLAVGAKQQDAAVSLEERATWGRVLWKLHAREALLKGEVMGPHPMGAWDQKLLLYCRVGIGYHLQILPSGSVRGIHKPTDHCWLKVFAVKRGVVGIRGIKSSLYLCLSAEGQAYGAETFSEDCMLKENLEENHYNTYSSFAHPHIYLALSHKGQLRSGKGISHLHRSTHFLPRRTQ